MLLTEPIAASNAPLENQSLACDSMIADGCLREIARARRLMKKPIAE